MSGRNFDAGVRRVGREELSGACGCDNPSVPLTSIKRVPEAAPAPSVEQ